MENRVEQVPEVIDINEPRLVTGTCLNNLDSILKDKCLDPSKTGQVSRGGRTMPSYAKQDAIFFNVVGLPHPDTNRTITFADDLQYYECYLLIDEDALLVTHKNYLASMHELQTDSTVESIESTIRDNYWNILRNVPYERRYLVKDRPESMRELDSYGLNDYEKCPRNPTSVVTTEIIRRLKAARTNTPSNLPKDAYIASGLLTTHKISLSGIKAIVLSKIEDMEDHRKISKITTLKDATVFISELFQKYGIQIPVYDCNNNRLI